jgi:hypothetical protein
MHFIRSLKKARLILPVVYLVVALGAWLDFASLPPDGLASLGLWLVVFPIALLDIALRSSAAPGSSVFMPDGHGYYGDHAIFFSVSVLIMAVLLYVLGGYIDRLIRQSPTDQ